MGFKKYDRVERYRILTRIEALIGDGKSNEEIVVIMREEGFKDQFGTGPIGSDYCIKACNDKRKGNLKEADEETEARQIDVDIMRLIVHSESLCSDQKIAMLKGMV